MDRVAPPLIPPLLAGARGEVRIGIVLIALVAAALLALPGATVVSDRLDRLFLLFDGIHRIAAGHIPGRDFHTALGPLAHYLPWLGYRLTGSFGAAMPMAMALATLGLGLLAARLLADRLRPPLALLFSAFLMLVLAAPSNPGDPLNVLSFDLFENRIGWVALALLLVTWLVPLRERPTFRTDALCTALLALVLLATRPTYGLIALVFLFGLALSPSRRPMALTALAIVAMVASILAYVWGGFQAYLGDVRMVWQAGGIVRGTPGQILDHALANLTDVILLALMVAVASWRRARFGDFVFYAFCALAGAWLINHNDQRWGILSIHAAVFVAAELFLRRSAQGDMPAHAWANGAGVKLIALLVTLPTVIHCATALGLHAISAARSMGKPVDIGRIDRVLIADLWTRAAYRRADWTLGTIQDGAGALGRLGGAERLLVLPGPDPFSAALGLPPAKGAVPDMRWLATVSETVHIAPAEIASDVEIVMERVSAGGAGKVGDLYLPHVRSNFDLVDETANWRIYRKRTNNGAGSQTPMPSSAEAQPR